MSRVKLKIDNKEKKEKEKKVKKDQSMSHTQNTHTSTYLLRASAFFTCDSHPLDFQLAPSFLFYLNN